MQRRSALLNAVGVLILILMGTSLFLSSIPMTSVSSSASVALLQNRKVTDESNHIGRTTNKFPSNKPSDQQYSRSDSIYIDAKYSTTTKPPAIITRHSPVTEKADFGEGFYGRNLAKDFMKALQSKNYSNPHDFNYTINQERLCSDTKEDIFLLTYVHTSPDHYKRRMIIRDTWGSYSQGFNHKLVFFLGATPSHNIQDAVHLEADRYGDIVQEDFHDSYKNLTYKGIMALKWVSLYCKRAKFVLKTDDDIFVNIYSLVRYVQSMYEHGIGHSRFMLCHVWDTMKVMRDKNSKWYIPETEYKDSYFSRYCSGSAFIMTTDAIEGMYRASLTTPFFWVDDFYLTGLLPARINLVQMKFNSAYRFSKDPLDRFLGPNSDTAIFAHLHDLNKWQLIWTKLSDSERRKRT